MDRTEFENIVDTIKNDCRFRRNDVEVSELFGKTITAITGMDIDSGWVLFECSDGTRYLMYHEQDCCEDVYLSDVCGDVDDLIGYPVTKAEESVDPHEYNDEDESATWTFYLFATRKGYVTLRWIGTSNGYYSESVDFIKLPDDILKREDQMEHIVKFLSPGTFMAESTTKNIDSWDVDKALDMAKNITERHGAKPYGFYFVTTHHGKIVDHSGTYYIDGVVETLDQLKAKNDPSNKILILNMESNHWDRAVITNTPFKWTQPFFENDHIVSSKGEN